ncbi:MAG: toprim domain-containing protein [Actinobacteria bacterium]|nr:toprim domain-containing protein [Actinomycetota bacterium]
MADWTSNETYAPDQVGAVIESLGIDVVAETEKAFLCYCPFHHNTDTPAFAVNKTDGSYICFNASCSASHGGGLPRLVMSKSDKEYMSAMRFIAKKGSETERPLETRLEALRAEEHWPMLPQMKIDELVENFWGASAAQEYMKGRGFENLTLKDFEVGYEPGKNMVVVPIHDEHGNPIGVNGRSISGKSFKLTKRIPRNKVLFNLHRAKQLGGTVIVCESQFDAMRIHQAGYPNVICFLGSYISSDQAYLLRRYFERVIIMTDADKAGRKMGHNLVALLRGMRVEWAIWDWGIIYPHDAKDAGDMTDDEISKVIDNAVSHVSYVTYKLV